MKVLIWFCCILVYSIVVTSLRYAGVILGGIPTALLSFLLVFFPAPALSRAWSRRKKRHFDSSTVPSASPASEAENENPTPSDTPPTPIPREPGKNFYSSESDDGFLTPSSSCNENCEEPAVSPPTPGPLSEPSVSSTPTSIKNRIHSSTVVLSVFALMFAVLFVFFAVRSFLLQSSLETATADLAHFMELSEQYYLSRYDDGYERGYDVGYATHRVEVSNELSFWEDNAVLVTEHGERYHCWDCVFVQDRPFRIYEVSDAVSRGYTPCLICDPPRLFYYFK